MDLWTKPLAILFFAFETKYIPAFLYEQFEKDGEETDKMLNGYIAYLKKSKQGANEPGANTSVREAEAGYFTEPEEDIANIKPND